MCLEVILCLDGNAVNSCLCVVNVGVVCYCDQVKMGKVQTGE